MSSKNLARRGPNRVWQDYRNLRVPIELFDDVKNFLERRKHQYLLNLDRPTDEEYEDEGIDYLSTEAQLHIPSMIKQVIQQEFARLQGAGIAIPNTIIPAKKTAREKIKDLLIQRPNEFLTTIQIATTLGMPGPTCRQAARELAKEDPSITQISGRPSKYMYQEN